MDGKKKSDARHDADIYAAFGIHLGDTSDYGYIVGLTLNLPRIYSRPALAVAVGVAIANSSKPIPAALFDGVCATEQEARELAFRVNVARAEAKAKAAAKQGLAGIARLR